MNLVGGADEESVYIFALSQEFGAENRDYSDFGDLNIFCEAKKVIIPPPPLNF